MLIGGIPIIVVAPVLLANIAQGIQRATLIELVDGDEVGKVEHIDFFELGGCAVFRRHHIQGLVSVIGDFGIRLPDAGGFHNNQVELSRFTHINGILNMTA